MTKLVYGKGVNDMRGNWTFHPRSVIDSKTRWEYRVYQTWKDMLKRCYSSKQSINDPTYVGCIVCDSWLVLSNFIRDIRYIPNYQRWLVSTSKMGYVLDKEYWLPTRVYSLSTCGFSTNSNNIRERNRRLGGPTSNPNVAADIAYKRSLAMKKPVLGVNVFNNQDRLYFDSPIDAEKLAGFNHSCISACCLGRRKTHKGYYWFYI